MSAWNKLFTEWHWENRPSLKTPLGATLLQKINTGLSGVDDRVIELNARKMDVSDTLKMVADWQMDVKTGVITVRLKDGTTRTYDTALEKVPISGRIDTNTCQLIFTNDDGTTTAVDIKKLFEQYTFIDSATVGYTKNGGNISSFVKDGSITDRKIEAGYLASLRTERAAAQAASQEAAAQAKSSLSYANGTSGIRGGEGEDNAKYYSERSKDYMNAAQAASGLVVPQFYIDFTTGCLLSKKATGMEFQIKDGYFTGRMV